MRYIAMIATVIAACLPASAGAADLGDWVLVHALAGPQGFLGDVYVDADVATDGTGPFVIGVGDAWDDGSSYVGVGSYDHGHSAVDLGASFVERRVVVQSPEGRQARAWYGLGFRAWPNESVTILMFLGRGSFTSTPVVRAEVDSGAISFSSIEIGSGATAVSLSDASDRIALVAGSAGAGVIVHDAVLDAGTVGASEWHCQRCRGSWRDPNGRHEQWSAQGQATPFGQSWTGQGRAAFAGPAGAWRWEFTGIVTAQGSPTSHRAEPLLIAYAPIGEAFRRFDGLP